MTVVFDNGQQQLRHGDARDVLRTLDADSVQCVVTSPPYWSLRDYGNEGTIWGERPDIFACPTQRDHDWGTLGTRITGRKDTTEENLARRAAAYETGTGTGSAVGLQSADTGATCRTCGAWRGALGNEPSPDAFVSHLSDVFDEVRRVLKPDGTLWLNIGDTYAAADGNGLKRKDLIGVPWMLAFELRRRGWWLRQDIIWAKPNPMPEPAVDRCARSHDHIFLLSKSSAYYFDAAAIRETVTGNTHARASKAEIQRIGALRASGANTSAGKGADKKTYRGVGGKVRSNPSFQNAAVLPVTERNKRDVWTVPSAGFEGAHFATFPPALVKPCILAGSREGDIVLDPFVGSGTTAMVARDLGRRAIGIDANEGYLRDFAVKRLGGQLAMINEGITNG